MEFRKILTLAGPNIWARYPVLEAWVDLGDLKDSPSSEIPGFNDRVMGWLPQMIEHRCSVGERGGFFQRLRDGTYLAHILEHVTLELQARSGTTFGFGRARETSIEGLFRVAVRYEDEAVGRACLEAGRQLCLAAVYDRPYDVAAEMVRLRDLADDVRMGPSTRTLAQAARARGIPVRRLNDASLVLLGHGIKQQRTHRSATDNTGAVAESISDDKHLTKEYLRAAGVPIAKGRLVTSPDDAWLAAQEIGARVVVKPQDCNYGSGVVIGISKREQIEAAYRLAEPRGSGVLVEQMASGAEHRLLVVGGKFVAATRGNPAYVVGDGKQTVWELVESQLNSDPRRGEDSSFPLNIIERHPTIELVLEQEGYDYDSVPKDGARVMIQRNGNLSMDVTDEVHPEVARQAALAARVIGLDIAGIDVIADDISRPLEEQGGVVIEVNASPGLQMHVEPESGKSRPVGEAIVATLFPPGDNGRIPIVSVTGAAGTTEVARLIARLLEQPGRCVALACAGGTFIGNVQTSTADARDAASARTVLLNPLVEAAVIESSLEGILEEGLGFDQCQVAVVTSIGEGVRLDFREWEEKRALIYRAAGDVVLADGGALVLKAGEPLGEIVAEHSPGRLYLFATAGSAVREHVASGGRAVFPRDQEIVLCDGQHETVLALSNKLVLTEARLAAVAAAWACGTPPKQLVDSLQQYSQNVTG